MQNSKKIIITAVATTLSSILIGWVIWYAIYSKDNSLDCTSNFRIHSGGDILAMSVNISMSSGKGFVTLNGEYLEQDKEISNVSLKKEFTYTQNNANFIFRQQKNGIFAPGNSDLKMLSRFLPDFYISDKSPPHHLKIMEIQDGVWIFTSSPTPYFICISY